MSMIKLDKPKKDLYKLHYNIQQECEKMFTNLKKIKKKSEGAISFLSKLDNYDLLRSYPSTYEYLNRLYIKVLEQNCVFELFFVECEDLNAAGSDTHFNSASEKHEDFSFDSVTSKYMSADSNNTDETFMAWNELLANNNSTSTLKNVQSTDVFSIDSKTGCDTSILCATGYKKEFNRENKDGESVVQTLVGCGETAPQYRKE